MKTKSNWRNASFVFATTPRLPGSAQHPIVMDKICLEKANRRAATPQQLRKS
jgi:hypothetical protein